MEKRGASLKGGNIVKETPWPFYEIICDNAVEKNHTIHHRKI